MNNEIEKKVFIVSSIGTISFAIIGIIIFFITKSQAVLLDGLYSLMGGVTSLASIWVISLSRKKPSEEYHYGLLQARPMLQALKGIVVLGFVVIGLFNAINSIFSGGSEVAGTIIIIYSLLSVPVSALILFTMWKIGKNHMNDLLKLEMVEWIQDTVLSLGIGILFSLTQFIDHPVMDVISLYLDAIIVLIMGVTLAPIIIRTIIRGVKELLLGSPSKEDRELINESINIVCYKYDIKIKNHYYFYSGGMFYIDVEFLIPDRVLEWKKATVIRKETEFMIRKDFTDSKIFVSFYPMDEKLDKGMDVPTN